MIATLNKVKKGKNVCEDILYLNETPTTISGCIMDGCSTGTNSGWAVQSAKYILETMFAHTHRIVDNIFLLEFIARLEILRIAMSITPNHMLFTFVCFVYNKQNKLFYIRIFGDCTYYVDDIEHVVDQDNMPDYIGYYISKDNQQIQSYLDKYPIKVYVDVNSSKRSASSDIKKIIAELKSNEGWINSFNITMLGIGQKHTFEAACDEMGLNRNCLVTTNNTTKDMRNIIGVVSQSVSSSSAQQQVSF